MLQEITLVMQNTSTCDFGDDVTYAVMWVLQKRRSDDDPLLILKAIISSRDSQMLIE